MSRPAPARGAVVWSPVETIPVASPRDRGRQKVTLWQSCDWRSLLLVVVAAALSGCKGEVAWEPYITTVLYSRSAAKPLMVDVLRAMQEGKGLAFEIDTGDTLSLLSFNCRLLPTTVWHGDVFVTTVRNVPPVPATVSKVEMRVIASIRERQPEGYACFDRRDAEVTEWAPVTGGEWVVMTRHPGWVLRSGWDYLGIDIETRHPSGSVSMKRRAFSEVRVRFMASSLANQFERNVSNNIFNAFMDRLRTGRETFGICANDS